MARQSGYQAPIQSGYVAVSLQPDAAQALRELSFQFSGTLARRVTLSETVLIMQQLAFMHYASVEQADKAR